jgi:NADP-dependent 3-hydroxy acid dehydrogenase YdfG
MFDVNVRSIIVVSQAVAKGMIAAKCSGTIVNISSTVTPNPNYNYIHTNFNYRKSI